MAESPEPTYPAQIKKAPPIHVDVAARLSQPVPRIQLSDMPLAKAVELLATIGGLPVTIDADALAELGVGPRDSVSLDLKGATVAEALQAAATQKGLAMAVDSGQVLITAPAAYRETLRRVPYTVTDLLDGDRASADRLASLVERLVAPESWQEAGGRGTIAAQQDALVVTQTGDVHRQVLAFCEKLRNARHLLFRSHDDPLRFTLATRRDRARSLLDRKISLNFHDRAPLAKILTRLADDLGIEILVDHAALATADTSDRVDTTLTARKKPFATVLDELLRPLGLAYRTVTPGTIQVTTKEAAEDRLELEFYPIADWLSDSISGAALAERLKGRVVADDLERRWRPSGHPFRRALTMPVGPPVAARPSGHREVVGEK